MFRALIAERFPDHAVLGEEMGGASCAPRPMLGVRSRLTAPPTSRTACRFSAPRWRSKSTARRRWRPSTIPNAPRAVHGGTGGGAFLNGGPIRASTAVRRSTPCWSRASPTTCTRVQEIVGLFGAFSGWARAVRRLGSAAIDLCYVAAGRFDGFWESDLKAWDIAGGSLIVRRRREGHRHGRAAFGSRGGTCWRPTG